MQRAAMCLAGLALYGVQPLASQEQRPPAHVYEAYYRIDVDQLDDWNEQYWKYSVPVLTELRDEGVIQGWGQWQHQTGGEYNVRFVVRTYDWASLGTFWDEYLSRLQAVTPEAEWEAGARMIAAHRDEIWDIGEVHLPEEGEMEATHFYASTFQVNFADMEEWNRLWTEVATPILDKATSDGLLGGWVKLNHNTGGPHNSKVLYFFDSWDEIDDFFGRLQETLAEEHPDAWSRISQLIQAHDDVIWVPTPRGGM